MKKECAHIRKELPRYLQGHLFKLEQMRIERHLRSCVVCYSQYQALKRVAETKKYLKDITPPEGVVQRVKEGVSGLAKLKKVLYRPLWIAVIVVAVAVIYYVLTTPRQIDVEIEKIVTTAPSSTLTTSAPPASSARPAVVTPHVKQLPAPLPGRDMEPLVITILTQNDTEAVRYINAVMRGHGQLRKYKFTDTVREISGSLTAKELLTFFRRIESVGKASYNQKRFVSFPSAQPIPFVMNLTVVPKAPEKSQLSAPSVKKSHEAELPVVRQGEKPAETTDPSPLRSVPTPSAAQ